MFWTLTDISPKAHFDHDIIITYVRTILKFLSDNFPRTCVCMKIDTKHAAEILFSIVVVSFVWMKKKTTADHSYKWNIIWVEGKKEAISFCKMEFSSNLISQKPVPCQFLEPDKSSTHVHFKKEKTIKDNLSGIFATYFYYS